jgi:hypothetical protein
MKRTKRAERASYSALATSNHPLTTARLRRFQARFLKEIEELEPPPLPRSLVPQRADLIKLYTSFLRTPHFTHWWECQRCAAARAPPAHPNRSCR